MIEFRRKMIAAYGKDCLGELGAAIKDPQQVEKASTSSWPATRRWLTRATVEC